MKRTLSYVVDLAVCAAKRDAHRVEVDAHRVEVEERGDIEQGSCVLPIEQSLFPTAPVAPLMWDSQMFHVADYNGMPGETVKFDTETQLQGYWWEVLLPGHDIQYWFSGEDFIEVKHKLPRDSVVLRHLQKSALNTCFPVASKRDKSQRLLAKASMAAFLLRMMLPHGLNV